MLAARTWFPLMRALLGLAAVSTAWVSLLPPDDIPSAFAFSDWLMHGLGYGVLGFLAVASGLRWPVAFISVTAFGVVLEMVQGILGYRSFEVTDMLADAVGAAVGAVLAMRVLAPLWRRHAADAQQAKRDGRRMRAQAREQRRVERAMGPAKAAAKRGAPTWQQVAQRHGSKCELCGTRTYVEDRRRQKDGSERLGKTYPTVIYLTRLDAGGRADLDNARIAHRHCASVRESQPARREFGSPPRTYA